MLTANVNIPKATPSNVKAGEIIRVLMPVIIILVIAFLIKKFKDGFFDSLFAPFKGAGEVTGIIDTDEEKKQKAAAKKKLDILNKSGENPFNPNYFEVKKKNFTVKLLTQAAADKICKQIWDAIGIFYDSPENVLGAIKGCTAKTQVSFVAYRFAQLHEGKDLLAWLEQKLDTTEQKIILGKIIDYVNGLPVGKV